MRIPSSCSSLLASTVTVRFITVILRQWTKIAKSAKGKKGKEPASSQAQTDSTASTTSTAASPVPGLQAQATQSLKAPPAAPALPAAAAAKAVVVPTLPTPQRQKIQELLAKTLSMSSDEKDASSTATATATAGKAPHTGPVKIAVEIEQLCWEAYPCDASGKQTAYSAKIRTLNFNLKKNDTLRVSVLKGSIMPARLILMSTDQLAATHIVERRKHAAAEDEESRRYVVGAKESAGVDSRCPMLRLTSTVQWVLCLCLSHVLHQLHAVYCVSSPCPHLRLQTGLAGRA